MSGRVGSITTDIIADGLVFNMDAANRASTIPSLSTTKSFNTIDTAVSGSFINDTIFDSSTITPSFAFDGISDRIECSPSFEDTDGASQLTIGFWLKADDTSENRWCGKYKNTSNWLSCQKNANGLIYFVQANGGLTYGNFSATSVSFSIDTWYYYVGVFDGTQSTNADKLKIYWNAINKTLNFTGTIPSTTAAFDADDMWLIGGDGYNYNTDGNIGPMHIYNRALSANEVLHNYNALKGRFGL